MAASVNQDFVTYVGDDVSPIFTVVDSTGAAVDISSVTEIVWICQHLDTGSAAVTLKKSTGGITFVTTGTDGKFQVAITHTITATLAGFYIHEASITDATGNVTTVSVGRMQVGVRPSWTYDASSILTVPVYQVRRLIGDVISNDPQIYDAEISFALTQRSTIYGAAAECCSYIASQYARKVDVTSPGEIRTAYSSQAAKYKGMAAFFNARSATRGGGVTPYSGGISVSDKVSIQADTNRVQPQFVLAMQDNLIPVPVGGNELLTAPLAGGAG